MHSKPKFAVTMTMSVYGSRDEITGSRTRDCRYYNTEAYAHRIAAELNALACEQHGDETYDVRGPVAKRQPVLLNCWSDGEPLPF